MIMYCKKNIYVHTNFYTWYFAIPKIQGPSFSSK